MRCALHASGIAACIAVCAAAGAQTATVTVPPSKSASEQWQGIANTSEFQSVQTVTDFKNIQDIVLRGVTRIAKDPLAEEVLDKAAKPFAVVGTAFGAYEVGEAYKRGDTAEAAKKGTRLAIDSAVAAGCASLGLTAGLPCEASYAAGTIVGDVINEHTGANDWINENVYEPIYDGTVIERINKIPANKWVNKHIHEPIFDTYQSFAHPELDPEQPELLEAAKQKHQDAMAARRQEARDRFERTSSANQAEQLRIDSELAAQSAPPSSTAHNPDNKEFADFLGTLTNEYAQQQQLQSVPAQSESPSSSPSATGDCHPNHDEQKHPGGCHRDPQ